MIHCHLEHKALLYIYLSHTIYFAFTEIKFVSYLQHQAFCFLFFVIYSLKMCRAIYFGVFWATFV